MDKIILSYGTRPELIKVAPIIWEFEKKKLSKYLIIVNTNQHKHTLSDDVLGIVPDYNLQVFEEKQTLIQMGAKIFTRLDQLLKKIKNNKINILAFIAQGDTISTLCSAQVSFLNQIPFHHIEAGLRSKNINSPFPEEFFRRTIAGYTSYHYAPSFLEKNNLIKEGISNSKVFVVGNTVNDILLKYSMQQSDHILKKDTILISIHRTANKNESLTFLMDQICALKKENSKLKFVWLVHPHPFIKTVAEKYKTDINLIYNANYLDMMQLYAKTKMVITDSGGIMEESSALGIPRIIIRQDNERIGILNASDTFIFDSKNNDLKTTFNQAIKIQGIKNYIYGKGDSSEKICNSIKNILNIEPHA